MKQYALVPIERLTQLEKERKMLCNAQSTFISMPVVYIVANRRWHTIKLPDFLIKYLKKR